MAILVITIVDPGCSETTIEVPGNQPVGRIVSKLTALLGFSPAAEARFILSESKTGRDLDPSRTLEEQGVASSDVLRLWTPDEPSGGHGVPGDVTSDAGKAAGGSAYPSKNGDAGDSPPPAAGGLLRRLFDEALGVLGDIRDGARTVPLVCLHFALTWLLGGYLFWSIQRDMGLSIGQVSGIRFFSQVAGLILPLLAGQAADRWMRGRVVLFISYLLSGACLLGAHGASKVTGGMPVVIIFLIGVGLFMGPTQGLVNALTLGALPDAGRGFPLVQGVGMFGFVMGASTGTNWSHPLLLGGGLAGAAGLYSLTLPRLDPERSATPRFAPAGALGVLKDRSAVVLVFSVFLTSALTVLDDALWSRADRMAGPGGGGLLLGLISESIALVGAGLFYRRLGAKSLVAIGILALILRTALLAAMGAPSSDPSNGMAAIHTVAQSLKGFRRIFLFMIAAVYLDSTSSSSLRSSIQCLLALLVMSAAPILGNLGISWIVERMEGRLDGHSVLMGQGLACTMILVAFLSLFKPRGSIPGK